MMCACYCARNGAPGTRSFDADDLPVHTLTTDESLSSAGRIRWPTLACSLTRVFAAVPAHTERGDGEQCGSQVKKRPGGRHDFPEHSFEHSNMHTSRRPACRSRFKGLHTPESPVESTGPNDTGSSTHSCSIGQLSNGMQRGPRSGPCSEIRHTPLMPPVGTSCEHAHNIGGRGGYFPPLIRHSL
eukprot:3300461-Prymnesium_polylepis.1